MKDRICVNQNSAQSGKFLWAQPTSPARKLPLKERNLLKL